MGLTLKNIAPFFVAAMMLSGCTFAEDQSMAANYSLPQTDTYSPRDSLKNWVLSICFANIVKNDRDASHDAAMSAAGYFEFGNIRLEERDELIPLVKKYIAREYGGHFDTGIDPAKLNTMKCIDLFHSAELDALITRMLKDRNRQQ
ncbi:MAG: type VI secretion system amidase immunity protein Tai4 [Azoarcus sp.]|jgi:hypothetical protein|nr:type VI secretion system amidase immunity protein Tai4 [Azoarcus sp.]